MRGYRELVGLKFFGHPPRTTITLVSKGNFFYSSHPQEPGCSLLARTRFRPDGCFSKIMALVTHPGRVQEFSFVFAFLRNKEIPWFVSGAATPIKAQKIFKMNAFFSPPTSVDRILPEKLHTLETDPSSER